MASANGPAGTSVGLPNSVAGSAVMPPVTRSPWMATMPPLVTACSRSSAKSPVCVLSSMCSPAGWWRSSKARVCGSVSGARTMTMRCCEVCEKICAPRS